MSVRMRIHLPNKKCKFPSQMSSLSHKSLSESRAEQQTSLKDNKVNMIIKIL